MKHTRRAFVVASTGAAAAAALTSPASALGLGRVASPLERDSDPRSPPPGFPSHDPELVREMVGVSHGNFEAVRSLLDKNRELAKAAWDWGFGDWESALGAASHVGQREIAELLIANGARPDIFTFAMLGCVDVVRACVEAMPGIQKLHGPHGITLLAHAKAGKQPAEAVVEYLQSVGGADEPAPSAPLDPGHFATYIGEYRFGAGETSLLVVKEQRGSLFVERPGGTARGLRHIGDHTFSPAGARSVKLVFSVEGRAAVALRIEGYLPETTAQRVS